MTISSETNRSGPYNCNGATTVFPFGFKIYQPTHLKVILTNSAGNETVLTYGTQYTVAGVGGDGGGSITTTSVYTAGNKITILLNVPFTQAVDLENQGAYFAETIERAIDQQTQMSLQLKEQMARAYKAPANYETGGEIDPSVLTEIAGNAAAVKGYRDDAAASATAAAGSAAVATTKAGEASASATAAAASAANAAAMGGLAWTLYTFTASAGQTVFNFGTVLTSLLAMVFQNGAELSNGDDYTITATTLTLASAASAGDRINVRAFNKFAVANTFIIGNNLSELPDIVAARNNLGLRSAATKAAGDPALMPSGSVIGRAYNELVGVAAYTATIPFDNTTPQNTEGTAVISVTYTPKVAGSKLHVKFLTKASNDANQCWTIVAAFLNNNADAFDMCLGYDANATAIYVMEIECDVIPSGLTPQTVTIRVGNNGGTTRLNLPGYNSFGNMAKTTLIVEEIMP